MRVGPYEVLEEVGRGGMGAVFRARGPTGEVAVKLLLKADPERLARFERERRLIGLFTARDGFVALLDAGDSEHGPYVVMPFVPGGTLRARLARGPLGRDTTRALGEELAAALARAHERGIVHRDLKPENILFAADGRPLIADLGLAKHFDRSVDGASQSASLSTGGVVRGTFGYMAPEQVADSKSVGPPADVFALGAILYECLAGKPAFVGSTFVELLVAIRAGRFVPLRDACPGLPSALAGVIERALAASPVDRPADGRALRLALRDAGRSGRSVTLAPAAAVVVLTLLVGVSVVVTREPGPPAVEAPAAPARPLPQPTPPPPPEPRTRSLGARQRMLTAEVEALEKKFEHVKDEKSLGSVSRELRRVAAEYPEDSRPAFLAGMVQVHEEGRELAGRRELLRALTLKPELAEDKAFTASIVIRACGFDVATTAIAFRSAPGTSALVGKVARDIGMQLILVEPPYRDPARARELLERSITAGFDPWVTIFVLHARFGCGEREMLAPAFESVAEKARDWSPAFAEELVYRAGRCRTGVPSDRMAHVNLVSVGGSPFVKQLQAEEKAWRDTWRDDAGLEPAKRLTRLARDEASRDFHDNAAVAHLGAARALRAAGDVKGELSSLRDGFEAAARGQLDVRSLLARAYARALLAGTTPDAERAEQVARAAVQSPAAREPEWRLTEEIADGWLVLGEALLARGKKTEARESVEKGLGFRPFDKRPFEAVLEKAK